MKEARIFYVNDDQREGYQIDIKVDGEWGLNSFFPLVRRENASSEEERNFVHFGIVNKLSELQRYGYQIYFL